MNAHDKREGGEDQGVAASTKEKAKRRVHRVQIDFSEAGYAQLLELVRKADAGTISAAVRDALGIYDWFVTEKNAGAEFLVRKKGELEKVSFR